MANKYDLNYVYASGVASNAATSIGGAIAAGKTRFLTYIRVTRTGDYMGASIGGHVMVGPHSAAATGSASDFIASRTLSIILPVAANGSHTMTDSAIVQEVPETPDMNHPILSVAGGSSSYMLAGNAASSQTDATCTAPVDIFAIYYDE